MSTPWTRQISGIDFAPGILRARVGRSRRYQRPAATTVAELWTSLGINRLQTVARSRPRRAGRRDDENYARQDAALFAHEDSRQTTAELDSVRRSMRALADY